MALAGEHALRPAPSKLRGLRLEALDQIGNALAGRGRDQQIAIVPDSDSNRALVPTRRSKPRRRRLALRRPPAATSQRTISASCARASARATPSRSIRSALSRRPAVSTIDHRQAAEIAPNLDDIPRGAGNRATRWRHPAGRGH